MSRKPDCIESHIGVGAKTVKDTWACVAALALLTETAAAQIVLDAAYLRSLIGQRITMTVFRMADATGAETLIDLPGGPQVFDIRGFPYDDGYILIHTHQPPSPDLPGASDSHFAAANQVIITEYSGPFGASKTYTYNTIREDGLFTLGQVAVEDFDRDGQSEATTIKKVPPYLVYQLPLTVGTQWAFSYEESVDDVPVGSGISEGTVDGWGTLVTPAGEAPCLRVRVRERANYGGFTLSYTSVLFVTRDAVGADVVVHGPSGNMVGGYYVMESTPVQ